MYSRSYDDPSPHALLDGIIARTPRRFPDPFTPAAPTPIFTPHRYRNRKAIISTLTSKQRAHLRTQAHHLDAILHVGVDGVSDAVVESAEEAFNTRELLKMKVLENAPLDVDETAAALAAAIDNAQIAQTIGRVLVLYRPHPDNPELRLPS